MTDSDWNNSYEIQKILKFFRCEITEQVNSDYVNIYNKKSEKIISIKATGKIPPFEVKMIFQVLKIDLTQNNL